MHGAKKTARTIIKLRVFGLLVVFSGLGLLLYPTIANWWNETKSTHVIAAYQEETSDLDETTALEEARDYNRRLSSEQFLSDIPTDDVLDLSETGVFGSIQIPSLGIQLPIYHGVSDQVLSVGVGHLPGTSFPVGGEGTHAVLSGHSGMASRRLFTGLENLSAGDVFLIQVLGEQLVYEVQKTQVVRPEELDALNLDPELDQVTLLTCTPPGENTHRLLVTGVRIPGAVIPYLDPVVGDLKAICLLMLGCIALGICRVHVWIRRLGASYHNDFDESEIDL